MSKKVALFGMYIALAFVLSYIENVLSLNINVPGVKLGLANLVVITALYISNVKTAIVVSVLRIILTGFVFSSMTAIIYSLAGGILSLMIMILLKKVDRFSITGVSIAGGITHNFAQIIVAALMFKSRGVLGYLPILIISGMITGFVIGVIGANIVPRLKKILHSM